jgi:hypothetical protein
LRLVTSFRLKPLSMVFGSDVVGDDEPGKSERLGRIARLLDLGCGRDAEHRGGSCDALRAPARD